MPKVFKTYVSDSISELGTAPKLVVLVTRQPNANLIEVGSFLVDTGCLGVKDAFYRKLNPSEFQKFLDRTYSTEDYVTQSGPWGRKFIESVLAYAKSLGFKAHSDYKKAARVFGGIKADECDETFEFGLQGQPFYHQGPHDSDAKVEQIIRQLTHRCGEGNFKYALGLPIDFEDEEEEFEDEREEITELMERAQSGELESAAPRIAQLAHDLPQSTDAQFAMGLVHALKGEFEQAIQSFDTCLALDPTDATAWYNKSLAHRERGEPLPTMIALYKAGEFLDPEAPYVEQTQAALQHMAKEIQKDYGVDLDTYIQSAEIYLSVIELLGHRQYEAALEGISRVIELNPRSYYAYGTKGVCHLMLGEVDKSIAACERSLEIKPDYSIAQQQLKHIRNLGDRDPKEVIGKVLESLK